MVRSPLGIATAALAVLLTGGCDGDPPLDHAHQDGAFIPGQVLPIADPFVELLGGFDRVLLSSARVCVEPPETGRPHVVGGVTDTTTLHFIRSSSDLQRHLQRGGSFNLGVRGIGAEASLSANLDLQSQSTSTYLLLRSAETYDVRLRRLQEQNLRPFAVDLINRRRGDSDEPDLQPFLAECGTNYVAGVRYQAALNILIRIDAETASAASEVTSSLGVTGIQAGPVDLGGTIEAISSLGASIDGVTTQMFVEADGFTTDVNVASLTTVNPATLEDVLQALSELNTSIEADIEHDALALDDPERGTHVRRARPVGVMLGSYRLLANSRTDAAIYASLDELAGRIATTVSTVDQLLSAMESAVTLDLAPFLASPQPYAYYRYSDDFLAELTLDALQDDAREWLRRFDPEEDGSSASELSDLLRECVASARNGDYDPCLLDLDDDAVAAPVVAEARALVASFEASHRIRPVSWQLARFEGEDPMVLPYDVSDLLCRGEIGFGDTIKPGTMRLPTLREAGALTLVVMEAELPRQTEHERLEQSIWFREIRKDDTGLCPDRRGSVEFDDDGAFGLVCGTDHDAIEALTPICVPITGPFGEVPALGP